LQEEHNRRLKQQFNMCGILRVDDCAGVAKAVDLHRHCCFKQFPKPIKVVEVGLGCYVVSLAGGALARTQKEGLTVLANHGNIVQPVCAYVGDDGGAGDVDSCSSEGTEQSAEHKEGWRNMMT
jgi:hypothetical protein